jgi:Uncharacterized metal-binding protein
MNSINLDRRKTWRISVPDQGLVLSCEEKETILDAMKKQGTYINAACGGRGTCGKCRIKLIEGNLERTSADRRIFTEQELEMGYRLACKAYPNEDCSIQITDAGESDFEVITEGPSKSFGMKSIVKSSSPTISNISEKIGYGIGIDLGTTTLALSLVSLSEGEVLHTFTAVNHQRMFGSDVITRMQLSNQGKQKELQECVIEDLQQGIRDIINKTGIDQQDIKKITIAGNTTMGHLLLGFSCKTLGTYPFTPINIQEMNLTFEKVFHSDELNASVTLLPGISAFVGGDITAGLMVCDFDRTEKVNLFIDLGTNGEMAIGNCDRILVSSTAAGPAFEGGNISCGVGSIAGAISNVKIENGLLHYKTIGDKAPVGICGTGVMELIAELQNSEIIDTTGLLISEFFGFGIELARKEDGSALLFTQKDIREFQMAKAAIRAGIEILVKSYGVDYDKIDTVYVAGGFGFKMNMEKAIRIGLFPRAVQDKIQAIGNSSLEGAVQYLLKEHDSERAHHIIRNTNEIHLSNDAQFHDLYIAFLGFE